MLIDLHCHTKVHSSCSNLEPAELVRLSREAGLDGVCLTEHDRLWDAAEIAALGAEHGFLVLRAIEVTTEMGHVLAYGLDAYAPEMASASALRRDIDAVGGFMALAHPARDQTLRLRDTASAALFDALEVMNGSDGRLQRFAEPLAGGYARPGIAGSDCHASYEAGACATRFDDAIDSEAALVRALRAGRYRAEALR